MLRLFLFHVIPFTKLPAEIFTYIVAAKGVNTTQLAYVTYGITKQVIS